MTNERSNGYAAGRDSMRWAVEKARKNAEIAGDLLSENRQIKKENERLREALTQIANAPSQMSKSGDENSDAMMHRMEAMADKALATKPGEGDG